MTTDDITIADLAAAILRFLADGQHDRKIAMSALQSAQASMALAESIREARESKTMPRSSPAKVPQFL